MAIITFGKRKTKTSAILSILILTCCESFVEVDPPQTSLTGGVIFDRDATANSAIVSLYEKLVETPGFASGDGSISITTGLSSDELKDYSGKPAQIALEINELTPILPIGKWSDMYNYIYSTNAILEGLSKSKNLSISTKSQIEGEAKFMRAFFYFYLTNVYGDIPLIKSTSYQINSAVSRQPQSKIYESIIDDLNDAKKNLKDDYSISNDERIRPNKYAASALLSRTHLYLKDWENAEKEASFTIERNDLFTLSTDLNETFLKNSSEAIWQLQTVVPGSGVFDASYFIITTSTPRRVALRQQFIDSFEPGDIRLENWVNSKESEDQTYYYPFKYKEINTTSSTTPAAEYLTVFRLSEQYLIRSEARANLGNLMGANEDLNKIRNRALLEEKTELNKDSIQLFIEQERRIELFSEWGHRWFDLKRLNRVNEVLTQVKGDTWQSTDSLYPIPQSEIDLNSNLKPQNAGY